MRLSDYKDEKGIQVVGKILEILPAIAAKDSIKSNTQNPVVFASALLQDAPKETKKLLAILADKEPSEYECNGATVLMDIVDLVSDPVFMQLFGVQRQTSTSSTSASESSEAETVQNSSITALPGNGRGRKKKTSGTT